MRYVFWQKSKMSGCILRADRILLAIPIFFYLCSFPSYAQVPETQSSITKSSTHITGVMPEKAYPGDTLEIFLNADISKYSVDEIKVSFDGVSGDIISTGPDVLKVRVPIDLPASNSVWVVVAIRTSKTPPARMVVLPIPLLYKIIKNPLYLALIISVIIGIGIVLGLVMVRQFRKRPLQEKIEDRPPGIQGHTQGVSSLDASIEAEPKLEPPQVPDELIAACQKGECIVFAGADLSKAAGLPTWQEFVQSLLQWAMDSQLLDMKLGSSYRDALQKGEVDLVADGVARAVQTYVGPRAWESLLFSYLQKVFVSPSPQPTKAHRLLKQIGFAGALTTNLDSLLEQALEAPVFTPRDAQKLLPKLAEREPFILKLYGTLDQPQTVKISPVQFKDAAADNRIFLEFVEKLFLSRTVLFVGTSMDSVQSNLEAQQLRNIRRSHYALVGVSGSEWRAKAESLRRFNVQTLPYPASEGDAAVVKFLNMLAERVVSERRAPKAVLSEPPCLRRVQLENIGPFDSIDLQLHPQWNILLGDNGVGKSSIIKAIALALCGKEGKSLADRLIKFGRPSGRIVLELTDGATNVTDLYRTSAGPEVKVRPQRELLGTERWLAMGFPPLRQVGWTLPKGPQPKPGTPYTTPNDLLPLVEGDLDPRMTDLKQSILNFDYQSKAKGGERYQKLLDDFFEVIDKVTEGVTIRKGRIDPKTYQIYVITDDGEVPLAAVSQGTQSLMGWIGLLLQGLYEVYDNTEKPREAPALVLIDEIDAHMHPEWQQKLVRHLKELFPKVQFIATTHSPLVTLTSEPGETLLVQRTGPDHNQIVVQRSELDVRRWRADQVLTTLFGLESSNPMLYAWMKEYTNLLARDSLDEKEEDRLHYLASMLEIAPPEPFEREEARLAYQSIKKALDEQLASIPEEKLEEIRKEAKVQVLESISRKRRPL